MGLVRFLLVFLLLATLYVASLVLFPVEEVEVVGLKHLQREDVLARAGLYPGEAWLWVGPSRLAPLRQDPWVAEAHLEKPRPGAVRLLLREREPFLPLADGSALAEDGTLLPGGAPYAPGPRVEGTGPLPKADLLALARAFPKAKRLRYTPAGYWVEGEGATLFAPEVRFLLEYAQTGAPLREGRIYLYSWGVSVGP
ncbi:cell division protein FtsQ/DivIB [Thermus sp.]|uniref:cell division protein FtsQ/DivIB n=1 Tax=Thermus sp. TaxID=275 RepID=UPI003D11A359